MTRPSRTFLDALFDEHGEGLRGYITSKFRGAADPDDISQDAWLRMQRIEDPEALENPRAFLYQTATNLALDHLRRVERERAHFVAAVDEEGMQDEISGPDRTVDGREQLQIVEDAVAELPDKCREAFLMHRTGGATYPEIARHMGVSTSMVEKYVMQALKHCRRRLESRNRLVSGRGESVTRF